jgi:molecular chaperone DnaK (HSP70)
VLIPRNTPLPASVTRRYGVVRDGQRSVAIQMLEGEGEDPNDCLVLGVCRIEPLPADVKRGSPIDVTFTYDNSGRLHVKAIEGQTQSWASLTIERRFGIGRKMGIPI